MHIIIVVVVTEGYAEGKPPSLFTITWQGTRQFQEF